MKANLSVVARRSEPADSLDYYPTPPWATRAFMDVLTARGLIQPYHSIWEPACGEGHMAAVLAETNETRASDIFDYGYGEVVDFLAGCAGEADWIITNPPFNRAIDFAREAQARCHVGVAFIVRTSWLESAERYRFFKATAAPTLVLVHAGRVPMHKGRWEPKGKSATSYSWAIWLKRGFGNAPPELGWIRPDAKKVFSRPDDAMRFGAKVSAPLLDRGP